MCRATPCRICGKTTWAGCGRHVDAVKATAPPGQWCGGHTDADTGSRPKGFLARLLGR